MHATNIFDTNSLHLELIKVLLIDNDKVSSSLIQEQAKHFGYHISNITKREELSNILANNPPEIILVDIDLPYQAVNGFDFIKQLQAKRKIQCPIIFLSSQESFTLRLEAIRAGSSGYIVKPVNILELVEILDKYTRNSVSKSYRALIIDNAATISNTFETALESNNFICKTLATPLSTTAELISFRPHLILLSTDISGWNSLEISAVIRQDNRFTHIPIIFLTSDNRHHKELLQAGGDNVFNIHTDIDKFISYATTLCQRSRKLNTLISNFRKDKLSFQVISRSTQEAIICLNKYDLIISWNNGAENIFDYQAYEAIGQPIDIIIPEAHKKKHLTGFSKFISQCHHPSNKSIEGHAMTKNRELIPIEFNYTGWQSGQEQFFTSVIRNLSDQESIKNELSNQQASLKAIVCNSDQGIITMNEQGIIEMINPKALEIFAYSANELIGQNLTILLPKIQHSRIKKSLKQTDSCLYQITDKAIEMHGLRKDNSVFPIELKMTAMSINRENKFVGILQDISERRKVLKALKVAKQDAENANKAKSHFLSTMSHELRTPLNVILGFTQILLDDLQETFYPEQITYLRHIDSSGLHLLNLINDVLDLSTIESGQINLVLEDINLLETLNESLSLISPQAHQANIKLENKFPSEGVPFIKGDRSRLLQIFSNLLTNAIKYNRTNGSVSTWLSLNNNKARIYIKNTGQGIPELNIHDLFMPFKRLAPNQSEIEGTGIGLTITKILVELLGGTIGVENEEGESCTFWVEWPYIITEKKTASSLSPADTSSTLSLSHQFSPNSIKILYIEDNPSNRLLMKKIITKHTNFQYYEAITGNEGIQTTLKIHPDIILLDINLPDLSGFEVLNYLQKNNINETTQIIAVSANAMPDDIDKAREAGFIDYLTKPIDQQLLLSCVHKTLTLNSSST